MLVFLDFEASSLAAASYPIEIGWVFEDGLGEAHLIRPAPAWTDWDPAAEAIHHLPRQTLLDEGEPHEMVARRALETLTGHTLYASAPSWDGKWLSVLLRAAGLPRHALRLADSDQAHLGIARSILSPLLSGAALEMAAAEMLEQARTALDHPPRHRALDDARQELAIWREVRRASVEARRH